MTDRDVIVIDEAGMVGTRSLLRVIEPAVAAGAKVVLIGDPRQLPELEAGGAFARLAQDNEAMLTTNRRQTEAWERDALAELRAGDPQKAFATYEAHGRVHHVDGADGARDQLVDDWHAASRLGEDALMVAGNLRAVDDLNRRARDRLRAEGRLGPDRLRLGGRGFAIGDQVLALRNDRDIGVLNGTRATIEQIDQRTGSMHAVTDDGSPLSIPVTYIADGHLTHGYATTIHKAQGATVDRCFVLAEDTLTREHAYTAMSRGRHGNDLYLAATDRRAEQRHGPEVDPDPLDRLRQSIQRSIRQQLAVDQLPADVSAAREEEIRLRRQVEARPDDPRPELARIAERRRLLEQDRTNAGARAERAQERLDDLGLVGRRLHRPEAQRLRREISGDRRRVSDLDARMADVDAQVQRLAPKVAKWDRWYATHGPDLERLTELNLQINVADTLQRERTRSAGRSVDHDIGHGIEL